MKKLIAGIISILMICTVLSGQINDDLIVSKISKENYKAEPLKENRQYIDRRYMIMEYPSFLSGAKLIRTANEDKSSRGEDFLSFYVNKSVSVFIAHWSEIVTVPSWLKDNYQKTDLKIDNGDGEYVLYLKNFPAGEISLGGNIQSDESDHAMYSVIVSPRTDIPKTVDYINNDYLSLLAKYSTFKKSTASNIPYFTYQSPKEEVLRALLTEFQLDETSRPENEIMDLVELMKWVNRRIPHNGSISVSNTETLEIINYSDSTGTGVNCRAVSIVLNDILLAMGYKARIIYCLPHEDYDTENHVTNLVYSQSLNKWIFLDPSFCAYVTDENGLPLDHSEIREALTIGKKLIVEGGLIHNGQPYYGGSNAYLNKYMAKNLFRFMSPLDSEYGYESSDREKRFIILNPVGYKEETTQYDKRIVTGKNRIQYFTQDGNLFWNEPDTD